VGYADAAPDIFVHRKTYRDVDSDLRLLSVFGLQTWDSIRAIDFVLSLPEVDPKRLAITGASGGGTQTFMMMATDDRLAAAAPVCMISAGDHQGGCVCENNSLLRVGTDNVELTSTFAPRPFVHPTATGDWTKNYLEQGYPQTKAVYALFGAEQNVFSFRQKAEHNYNLKSREAVYNFFNQHLKLGHEGVIAEQHFTPLPPKELSVWDADHPRPATAVDPEGLKKYWVDMTARQIDVLKPRDFDGMNNLNATLLPALVHMVSTRLPAPEGIIAEEKGQEDRGTFILHRFTLRRAEDKQAIPALLLSPKKPAKRSPKIYLSSAGKEAFIGKESPLAEGIAKVASVQPVLLIDVFATGELATVKPTTRPTVEFFAGYNRTTIANRVHDTLTAIAFLRSHEKSEKIDLVAAGDAGPWCLLARALAEGPIGNCYVSGASLNMNVKDINDSNYLPGILRYGGIGPFASLGAFMDLHISGPTDPAIIQWLRDVYHVAGQDQHLQLDTP
jgi:hypothetical protein